MIQKFKNYLNQRFHIIESGSSIRTEVFSGLTAYFTTVYLLFLIPSTLMNIFPEAFGQTGELVPEALLNNGITAGQMQVSLTVAACVAAAIGTFILSLKVNFPFSQGPSLAIGTFVTYTICIKMGYSYPQALAAIFISSILFFVLTWLKIEKKIQDAIPTNIKFAVTAGIGLFIAFMGLQKAHVIEANQVNLVQFVNIGDIGNTASRSALLCLAGIIVIAIMLSKKIHGAILIGKILCILAAIPLGLIYRSSIPFTEYKITLQPVLWNMDFVGLFQAQNEFGWLGAIVGVVVIVASLCIMNVFETIGAIIAVDHIVTRSKRGSVTKDFPRILETDAVSTATGAFLGMTNVTTYVESTSMVLEGGRTGLSGLITGILYLFTIFTAPVASVIPSAATATTLVISGVLMMNVIKYINFEEIEEALPAFFTMAMIPLTYNMVTGIALGFISHALIHVVTKKGRGVSGVTYGLTALFLIQLYFFHA